MLLLLPIACFILLCLHCLTEDGVRIAILDATLSVCVFVTLSTELLSFGNWLSPFSIAVAWSVALLIGIAITASRYGRLVTSLRKASERIRSFGAQLAAYPLTLTSTIAAFCLLAFTGLVCPPNNWDSLTYHLPRLFHWLANSSVNIYDTNCVRQTQMPPLSEYGLMHLWALTDIEGLFNLQQLFALGVSVVAATRLAAFLGSDVRGQLLSGGLTMSSWPVMLQSTTPKNDIVVGMFLLIGFLSAFRLIFGVEYRKTATGLGFSVALGLLTKGTAYLFFPPLIVIVGMVLLSRRRWAAFGVMSCSILISSLLVNAAYWQRNIEAFGSPLVGSSEYSNTSFGISTTVVNVLRVCGSSLATSYGFINEAIEYYVESIPRAVGLREISGTTYGDSEFVVANRVMNEDYAPFHLHIGIFIVALVYQLRFRDVNRERQFLLLAILVAEGLLFCSVSRWQIWITRLFIPLVMVSSVWIGVVVSANVSPKIWKISVVETLVSIMICSCFPVLLCNDLKRLVGSPNNVFETSSELILFASNPAMAEEQGFVCEELSKLSLKLERPVQLGFAASEDSYEYPLWTRGKSRVWPLVNMDDFQRMDFLDAIYVVDGQGSSLHLLRNDGAE
jgi:hypothetical protein